MESRPRPPLRLSVEERVDHAVQEAVRKALAKQRRTQEKELDNLSDALQKSLAALAGERDRALRSLAAEEDKRHDLIEDLSSALGGELSCADLSRLVVGLEKIEQEQERSVDEEGEEEPYGRSWVIEQLRQCLYARAAAQDHLRSAAEDVATDIFEAEELLGFDPAFSGHHNLRYTSPVCPPPPDTGDSDAGSADTLGVSRARSAASEALRTSVRIARERLEYLERLVRDVETGGTSRGSAATEMATVTEYKVPCATSAVGVDGLQQHEEGSREEDGNRDGNEGMGLDASGGDASVDDTTLLSNPVGEMQGLRRTESPVGEDVEERDAPHCLQSEGQGKTQTITMLARGGHGATQANRDGGDATGRGNLLATRARTGLNGLAESSESSAEAKRWKMAAHHAEASLADLRKTVGSVVSLSFRCGEERSRREVREDRATSAAKEDRAFDDDGNDHRGDAAVESASPKNPTENGAVLASGESVGREDGNGEEESGGAFESDVGRTVEGRALDEIESGSGGGGGLGPCCGRNRCSSCAIRAKAVGALLERLDALFAAQGEETAQMASSLDVLRRRNRAEPNAPLDASSRGGEAWTLSRDDGGREAPEHAGPDANTSAVDGRVGLECGGDPAYTGTEDRDLRGSASMSPLSSSSTGFQSEGGIHGNQEAGRRGRSGSRGAGGTSRDAAPKRDVRTEWEELEGLETHLARYQGGGGLGSPTVQGVLDRWIDVSKRRILEGWLAHVLHGGPVDAANGCFVPRVQISSLSKEVRDGLVTAVLPLLLGRRGVLLQVLTRERVELVHDIQIRVTPVAGRRDAPFHAKTASAGRRRAPVGEREHGARIRDMVMKAAHAGYVEEDEVGGDGRAWRTPLASVDSLSRQLKDTWENFNANFAVKGEPWREADDGAGAGRRPVFPEY